MSDKVNTELGMKYELEKLASGKDASELKQAGEYLHSALEIFESTGMHKQADQIVALMQKIAQCETIDAVDTNTVNDELYVVDEDVQTFEDD